MKTADTRFLWSTVRLPRHGAGPRIGDEERRLMHLVPALVIRKGKGKVLRVFSSGRTLPRNRLLVRPVMRIQE